MFSWTEYINNIELGLFIAFAAFAAIQLFYYFRYYLPVLFYQGKTVDEKSPLSIVICARNEAFNLEKNLTFVLEQDYPDFEVIIVNDCSTDNTDEVLGEYLTKYNNLRITNIPLDRKFSHGKKLALTVGIKSAIHEKVVFTDADCKPETKDWLTSINNGFGGKDIVLAYGGYERKKSLLNNYIRFDTLTIALTYLGFALAKKPYMGVGRNLAYTKKLFFKNKGFASNYGILSGDDDLFINEVSNKENTSIVIDKSSFTRSEPEKSWGAFFKQKIRHLSTARNYKKSNIFRLTLEPLSRAWFYTLLIVLLWLQINWIAVVSIAGFRTLAQFLVYEKAGRKFGEKNLWLSYIIFDVYSLFFIFVTYLTLSLRRRYIQWK